MMAEGIALQRFAESMLPEDVRIFSDPYAIHFLDPVKVAWAKEHPAETQALAAEVERKMPGWDNAIRGRIRYFDDVVRNASSEGFTQVVILGAGYDARAYRIDTLKGHTRVFEIDRPATQERKTGIVTKVFGQLPDHVSFIPHDIGQGPWWPALETAGYSPAKKTLFLLEGLVMYLPRPAVRELLAGIAGHAAAGSTVLFDFVPQSMADGSSDAASMGSQVAQVFAAKYPDRVRSLILVVGFPRALPLMKAIGYVATHMPGIKEKMTGWMFKQPYPPTPASFDRMTKAANRCDTRPLLKTIRAPTLIVNGRQDGIVPMKLTRELADGIPDARLVLVDGDHLFSAKDPDLLVVPARAFMAEVDGGTERTAGEVG